MIYEFQTLDDETFVLNTLNLTWGRASTILAAPSVLAAEQKLARFEFKEQGTLVPMGGGRYSLDGRTPNTKGAGAGLSTVGIMAVPFDTYLVLYLLPNVKIKEGSFKNGFPEAIQEYIKAEIRQPDEQKAASPISLPSDNEKLVLETPAAEALAETKAVDDSQ